MSKTSTARKPLYAYVGAVDFTVEKARELQKAQLAQVKQVKDIVPTVATLPTRVPAYVKELRGEAVSATTKLTKKADKFYGELAARGQNLVTSVRGQKSTKSAVASAQSASRQVKGATTSARKATRSAVKAADTAASKIG